MDMGCANTCRDGNTTAVPAPRRYLDPCEYKPGHQSDALTRSRPHHGDQGPLPGSDTLTGWSGGRAEAKPRWHGQARGAQGALGLCQAGSEQSRAESEPSRV